MRKLKILFILSILIALLYLIGLISFFTIIGTYQSTESQLPFGSYSLYINSSLSIIIFIGLLLSIQSLYYIIKEGFFSLSSKKIMEKAGYIFFLSGVTMIVLDIVRIVNGTEKFLTASILTSDIVFTLLGFVILVIADMAQIGYQLKSENDLTI